MIDAFDTFRKKRNISSYDLAGSVSDQEAKEMYELAAALRARVERWIRRNHPTLLAHATHS
jgi:predicted DNA-binding ribbon-helix-helix protein